jgi:hypothetical protein
MAMSDAPPAGLWHALKRVISDRAQKPENDFISTMFGDGLQYLVNI